MMKYSTTKIQSFGKTFGGKLRYARQYISLFPEHGYTTYCEPYAGGAGIFFNIPADKFRSEVLNDVDPNIIRTLTTLRDRGDEVAMALAKLPYTLEVFQRSKENIGADSDLAHTIGYITRNRMSSSGMFDRFATQNRLRGGRMGDENAWIQYTRKHVYGTIERLQGVQILNDDVFRVVGRLSSRVDANASKTLYLFDPPYLKDTRVTKSAYLFEAGEYPAKDGKEQREDEIKHHTRLLDLIKVIPGKRFICGYYSDLYNQKLVIESGFTVHTFDRPSDAGRTKTKSTRVEYLWESP